MTINTHLDIDRRLCGEPVELSEGKASVRFVTHPDMVADGQGLVHGGFVFGAADYAAMLAINDPNVVLGSANVRFVAPVKVGDVVDIVATRIEHKGKKHTVEVVASVDGRDVLTGTLVTFVLDDHVLAG